MNKNEERFIDIVDTDGYDHHLEVSRIVDVTGDRNTGPSKIHFREYSCTYPSDNGIQIIDTPLSGFDISVLITPELSKDDPELYPQPYGLDYNDFDNAEYHASHPTPSQAPNPDHQQSDQPMKKLLNIISWIVVVSVLFMICTLIPHHHLSYSDTVRP